MKTGSISLGAAMLCALMSGGAWAQTTADEIVVTGEKIDRSLQSTVTSVGVLEGEQLEQDGIDSLSDSFAYIANVNLGDSEGGFSIRGIPFDSLLGAGSSPLAQIYVDDVTIGDQATRFAADSVWDVSQVEVLRGAQSTVQGRNALAGAIIVRTADPTFHWEGKARSLWLASDYGDDYSVAFAGGGPLIDNVLAFRVALERREADGFVRNATTGEDGADYTDQWQARGKLLWTPAANFSALFTYAYGDVSVADAVSDRRSRTPEGYVNLDDVVPGAESLRQFYADQPEFNNNVSHNYSLNADWELSPAFTLTSITALSDARNEERQDGDGAYLDPATYPSDPIPITNPYGIPTIPESLPFFAPYATQQEDQTIFTQEFILSYDNGGRFRGLTGAYYAESEEAEYNFSAGVQTGLHDIIDGAARGTFQSTLTSVLDPLRGVSGTPVEDIPADSSGDAAFAAFVADLTDLSVSALVGNYPDIGAFVAVTSEPLDISNYAFYAQGEFDFTSRLTAGIGLRYDHEEQTEGLILSGDPVDLPDPSSPVLPPGFPGILTPLIELGIASVNGFFNDNLSEASTSTTSTFNALLPSGFIRYNIDEDRSVSFSMRRGYRSGGADLNIPRQFVSTFDPECTWNYEIALRSYWFDRALRLNANLFYTDWTDQQVVVGLSTLQQDEIGFNVGSSTLQGFEVDALWSINDDLSLHGSLGHVKTEFSDFDEALAAAIIEAQSLTAPIDLEETLDAFEGRGFSFAPEWNGALRLAYTPPRGVFGVLGVTYESESFVNNSQSSSPTFLDNDARWLVNATLGYEFEAFTVALVAHNLFDEEYVASGGDELVRLGAPREVGVRLQARF